jgi:hypothetical protein
VARTGVHLRGWWGQHIYVGEADAVQTRLDAHQKQKDFWTQGLVLTTNDGSLNKAHVRYLEARLLDIARTADAATIENGMQPPPPKLSEPATADMEAFIRHLLTLLPLVGITCFEIVERPAAAANPEATAAAAKDSTDAPVSRPTAAEHPASPTFYLRAQLIEAEARRRPRLPRPRGCTGSCAGQGHDPRLPEAAGPADRRGHVGARRVRPAAPDREPAVRVALRGGERAGWRQPERP